MVNWLMVGIGIFFAACAMIALIATSRDGYFYEFGINISLQGLIVVSLCFAFWNLSKRVSVGCSSNKLHWSLYWMVHRHGTNLEVQCRLSPIGTKNQKARREP